MYTEKHQDFIPEEELKEHPILRGFYKVKDSDCIYASKAGRFWSDRRNCFIKIAPKRMSYPSFNDGCKTFIVHIALANTFIRKPESSERLVVNHRDGDKNNFQLKNLEWVTNSENMFHAYKTGLFPNSRKVLLKNIYTQEILSFQSLNECARFLKINPSYLSGYLRKPQDSPFRLKYDLIYEGCEWNKIKQHAGRPRLGLPRAVLVIDKEKNELKIFSSAADAGRILNIPASEVSTRASGTRASVLRQWHFIWVDEFVGSLDGVPIVSPKKVAKGVPMNFVRKPTPILCKKETGEEKTYMSAILAGNDLGFSPAMIQKAARDGDLYKGWFFSYIKK